jgi:FKBP-type peptidyl-prolyl cis-trans isomerase
MKNVTKLLIALAAIATLGIGCSKYPGFKKDKQGFYYKFYVENKKEAQPQMGDLVDMTFGLRTKDSVLFENAPLREQITESVYTGDIYAAIMKMHLGDSATFILNCDTFAYYFWKQENPFDSRELYFDLKLNEITPKEQFEAMQTERAQQYEAMIEEYRISEDSLIRDYIAKNRITVKPTANGLYFMKKSSGQGKMITKGSKVAVHYTGKLIDGTVFDSSVERTPFELTVGQNQVIPGWEEALLMMRGGSRATVLIPSKLGYGSRGMGYVIPPYAPLIFDMEVVSVE